VWVIKQPHIWLIAECFHPLRRSWWLIVDGSRFKATAITAALKPNSNLEWM
jgi:hypothetical protein